MDPEPLIIRPSIRTIVPFYWLALLALIAVPLWGWYRPPRIDWLFTIPGVILLWTAIKHLTTRFTKLIIEADKVRYETGLMSRATRMIPLSRLQDVRVEQSVGQRILGTGDLTIESAGESGILTFNSIDRPRQVAETILSRMSGPEQRPTEKHG